MRCVLTNNLEYDRLKVGRGDNLLPIAVSLVMIVASMFLLSQSITSLVEAIVITSTIIVGGAVMRLDVAMIFAMLAALFAITPVIPLIAVARLLLLSSAAIVMIMIAKNQRQPTKITT